MNIAFNAQLLSFSKDYRTTGIGLYIMNLLEAIHKTEFPLTILSSDQTVAEVYNRFNHILSHERIRNPYMRILWEQTIQSKLLKESNIDLIHGPMHVNPIILPKRTASIITVHDLANFKYPQFYKGAKQKYLTAMTRISAKKADRIIAVSESTKQDLINVIGIKESKIDVVHNGLNLNIDVGEIDDENIIKKLGLPEKYLLFVGTMEPRKNISSILDALLFLAKEKNERYNLVIAGPKGWLFQEIEKKILQYQTFGTVKQTGYLSDEELVAVYQNAELFVYPSFYEGFGFPILESMALGTPVLCSETSSMPEVGGDAVEYVDPYNYKQLADKISLITKDTKMRAEMIKEGLKRSRCFNWNKAAVETIKVYEKI